jgi:hypothetical protein
MASHPQTPESTDGAPSAATPLRAALLESLYCDMLVLADEVRAGPPPDDMVDDPSLRVRVACESLRLSARLMRMTQLLLDHRAGRAVPSNMADILSGPLDGDPLPSPLNEQLDGATRLELRLADLVAPPPPAPPHVLNLQHLITRHFG